MDSNASREGWNPSNQPPNQPPGQSQSNAGPNGAPVLPPPQASFFSSGPPPSHHLPGIAGLTQAPPPHSVPPMPHAMSRAEAAPPHSHAAPQLPPSHGFSAINHNPMQHQLNHDHERERENERREMEEMVRRDAEQRDREMRDREYQAQQRHEPQIIHQPVAVPPNVRGIHGPNGLLGNPNAAAATAPAPLAPGPFPGAQSVQDSNSRSQPPPPASAPALLPGLSTGAQQGGSINQAQQPILNDALSYLDQVKVQFADHPDVYNRFLDIMKDFKSGAIDTPGVIERVSQLFAGNPGLIQGFNTFLPPGYKIECGMGDDPNSIRVTTPMGTTVSTMPAARALSPPRLAGVNGVTNSERQQLGWQHGGPEPRFSPDSRQILAQPAYTGQPPTSHPIHSPEAYRQQAEAAHLHRVEQQNVVQLQNAASAASARDLTGRGGLVSSPGDVNLPLPTTLNGLGPGAAMMVNGGVEKRGPVEFNHAISYVNKIKACINQRPLSADANGLKNRFAQQPDIYKQFLEILQTYQRESKPIQDVYAQVTRLFETAPDLLQDFKQFLPESAASNQNKPPLAVSGEDAFPVSSMRSDPSYQAAVASNSHIHQTPRPDQHRLPPMGNFAPTPSASRDNKRKRGERSGPANATPMAPEVNNMSGRAGLPPATNGNKRVKQAVPAKQTAAPEPSSLAPSLIPPPLPVPMSPTATLSASSEDFSLFDRLRKQIGNKQGWAEFVKLIALYKNDNIDATYLVFKAAGFIGSNPDLMHQLREFLRVPIESKVEVTNEPANVNGRIQLSNCRGLGPSYRLLPKQETNKKCSGRDDLCNAVLNDEWVSHPTWASEDSGFVAHRKNQHEEGLHRIEEERHDYDFFVESCRRSIQLMEPIAQALIGMTPEQRLGFELDPKLGGQSETIYKRVIVKIYGRERGAEVMKELFRRPYDVLPVLLARMKTQCEGWKAAQIQWEKVWRGQTETMFWKSLDHQGASTRVADKRQFFAKQLMNEIQVKHQEHKRQREMGKIYGVPNNHYAYFCGDKQVLRDSASLVLLYAEQNYSTEQPTLVRSIKELLTVFFQLKDDELDVESFGLDDMDVDAQSEGAASPKSRPVNRSRGLIRDVFKRGSRYDNDDSASRSRQTTPDEALENMTDGEPNATAAEGAEIAADDKWFEHPRDNNIFNGKAIQPNQPYQRSAYNMYANATLYCFMRLFGMLVERLQNLKSNEDEVRTHVAREKEPKAAHELGWIVKEPTDFFPVTDGNANYYAQMLDMFRQMVRGDMDATHIEETLRRYYLEQGWQLYSLDKMLGALSKFALGIFFPDAKEKTPDIYQLFKKDRQRGETITHNDEISYRRSVDKLAKEGEVYRIGWQPERSRLTIQVVKTGDPTFEPFMLSRTENWKSYVSSYETIYPTEGVEYSTLNRVVLKRNIRPFHAPGTQEIAPTVPNAKFIGNERMRFRVTPFSYGLSTEPGTSDLTINFEQIKAISGKEMDQETERRSGIYEEKARSKADWMKGKTLEEVDGSKTAFQDRFDEAVEPVSSGRRR